MKKLKWLKITLTIIILSIASSNARSEDYAPNEILVKFKSSQQEATALQALRAKINTTKVKKFQINNVYQIKLQSGTSVESAIASAYTDLNVEYAEPNYAVSINITPNDPSFNSLYGLNNSGQTGGTADADIDAPEAWNTRTDVSDNIIIAVIDTGVDYDHPDLAENIWINEDEIPDNGIDDDGNGYIDDYKGWDFANNDNNPMDGHGHGTHVSGTIAAVGNNNTGVVGVAWHAKIMPVKFLSDSGSGYTSDAIEAVQYATANGAKILSNSWGGGGYSQALKDAIQASHNAGTLFVAAAGNSASDNDTTPHYPSSYNVDNIISVAATDKNDNLASFSCYGETSVDLAAPGLSILSTTPNNTYSTYSGTSMATPHISGICALVWSEYPNLTNVQIKSRVLSTVDQKSNLTGKMVSGGRANLAKALALTGDTTPPAQINDISVASATYKSVNLTWTATGDDNSTGTASCYEIRYSINDIDEDNFSDALIATDMTSPKASGAQETFTIQGLLPDTTYYFAIKALDEWGNRSEISNISSAKTSSATIIYQDKMENGINGWTVSGTDGNSGTPLWHLSNHKFNSSTTSWYYGNEKDLTYDTGKHNYGSITSPTINLNNAVNADLIFNYWRLVESYSEAYDLLNIDVSYDNGSTWETLKTIDSTTASEEAWTSSGCISLETGSEIKIRFTFDTLDEYSNNYEGIYIDDIEIIGSEPEDAIEPSAITDLASQKTSTTYVTIQWTAPGDDENTGKALLYDARYSTSTITDSNWDNAIQVLGEPIPVEQGTLQALTVPGLTPNTKYYFGVKSIDNSNNTSEISNVISITTLAPPKTNIAPSEIPLVILSPDETAAETITISNTGNSPLEFSLTDIKTTGLNASVVEAVGEGTEEPSIESHPNPGENDFTAPGKVNDLNIIDTDFKSARLMWTAVGDDAEVGTAAAYDLRYSISPITEENFADATRIYAEPAPSQSGAKESVIVTGLDSATTYYFALKVLDNVVNMSELSNMAEAETIMPITVFSDDLENGTGNWTAQSPWAITDASAHSGNISWADNVDGNYNNNSDISLTSNNIDISNLSTASLIFWHKYELENEYDFGYVEVSADNGSTWAQIESYTGIKAEWGMETIDLASYIGSTIRIRFRLVSDDTMAYDGWRIDDISILGTVLSSGWLKPDITSGTIQPNESAVITLTYDATGMELGSYSTELNISTNDPDNYLLKMTASLLVEIEPPQAAPNITITYPQDGAIVKTSQINISGDIDYTYSLVRVKDVSATVRNSSYGATVDLTEGSNTITITATNSAGITSKSVTVTLDTTLPEISVTSPADGFKTKEGTIDVSGLVSDNIAVSSVTVNNQNPAINGNNFTLENISLNEGTNAITIQATDTAGNTKTTNISVIKDTTAPTVTIISPVNGITTFLSTATISGTVNDVNAAITINGASVTLDNNTFNKTINLSTGSNTITINAVDSLGNESSKSITIYYVSGPTINISPATLPEVTLDEGQSTTQTFTITNTGDSDLIYTIGVGDESISSESEIIESPISSANNFIDGEIPAIAPMAEHHPSRLLVKFKDGVENVQAENVHASVGARIIKTYSRIGVEKVEITSSMDLKEAMAYYMDSGIVQYAEPDFAVQAFVSPNDPQFSSLWGLHNTGQSGGASDADIDAPEAWSTTTGSSSVIIAVIDTGVDYNHPDLSANIWSGPSGEHGYDFCNDDSDPMDDNGHGTHTSGTIAAAGNNGIGVTGVNWTAKIMAVKFLSSSGSGYTSDATAGIIYAVDNGAKVLSNSWGGGGYSQTLKDAIDYANSHDVLFVAAAGNEGSNNDISPVYPSCYNCNNIISVAALDRDDELAYFSCYGATSVDIGAPGVDVLSTTPNNTYSTYSGTSMATPHVSGVAGLIISQDSDTSVAQLKAKILSGAVQIASLSGKCVTGGRLNANNSLEQADDTTPPAPVGDLSASSTTFQSITMTWTATGDDGYSGTASSYDIRYSTSQITDSNFDDATAATGTPMPENSGSTESFTVSGLSETTKYYIAIKVIDNIGNTSSISNVITAMTAKGTTVFSDTIESGTSKWTMDSPWGLVSGSGKYHSSTHSLTDSPTGNYKDSISKKLTSVSMDLSHCSSAKLNFWHKYALETYYDYAYVLISVDNGSNWSLLKTYNGFQSTWTQETIDLSDYCGSGKTHVKVRFLIVSDYIINYDGWYIDDVSVTGSGSGTSWLSMSPLTGTIQAGQSNTITLYYNGNVDPGQYSQYIYITSNDQINSLVSLQANLTVNNVPTLKWYLAEGCTDGFDEWVLIMNPNAQSTPVRVTFMKPDSSTRIEYITMLPNSRYTIYVNQYVPNSSVSALVESLDNNLPIVVERSMYWNSGNLIWSGGHNSAGTTSLGQEWYLAEGCTDGFDEWVLIMNPNAQPANITATFMKPDGSTIVKEISVGATSRYTIYVNQYAPKTSVSTKISSDVPVAVERSMYWDGSRTGYQNSQYNWVEGHATIGVNSPSTQWYLAEGCTSGFDEWILIMNPNAQPTPVTITFMKQDGTTVVEQITMSGTSRYTIHANEFVPNESISTYLNSDLPIIAERAMYWDSGDIVWAGGHISQGTPTAGTLWYLAEGCTDGFDEWVLIMNPNTETANVAVTFMKQNGSNIVQNISIAPTTRHTIHVNSIPGLSSASVSTKVESNMPVIAERSMYWNSDEYFWKGGHDSVGTRD